VLDCGTNQLFSQARSSWKTALAQHIITPCLCTCCLPVRLTNCACACLSCCAIATTTDVEDITSKTGSFKKFAVFVRMLQSAVLQQSDSVFVDLLTCQDLELLKAKKAAAAAGATNGGVPHQQQQLPASLASKRYLILTYASEFDRVHYPLPLLPDEQPDPSRFKAVIASLRQQLAAVTAGLSQHGRQQQQQLVLPQQRGRGRGANEQVRTSCNFDKGAC
jgi:coiled-coil domain-containing protein 61